MTGKQLKNSILQWAIQGKLVPQDPNDEPASVLLEKIRAEKARLVKEGKIKGIRNIGTYYYDDQKTKTNGEFDIAIETKDGFTIYEAKYLKDVMSKRDIYQEVEQIEQIKELKINKIGFVSINGFEEQMPPYAYINGEDLYS